MDSNPVVHVELHTPDGEGASAFYRELCGWRTEQVQTTHGSYLAMGLGSLDGGIVQCDAPRALWLPYVAVPSVARATEQARALGARILLEPREGPAGWRSVVATPAAGEIAFWKQKR